MELSLDDEKNLVSENLKQEGCLYQVVGLSEDGVYLQNVKSNEVALEKDLQAGIVDYDEILRYEQGQYIVDYDLTDSFFDSLVDINEYKEIQKEFMENSQILELDPETIFRVKDKGEEKCLLEYGEDWKETIEVPNQLIPFFSDIQTELIFSDGKFNRVNI